MTSATDPTPRLRDWLLFLAVPFFFSSNVIFGRGVIGDVSPFVTAFLRWFFSALFIAPFIVSDWRACLAFIRAKTALWLVLGVLGMGICGGVVYWGLTMTSAANGTLIYTTSSLFIILFQRILHGRSIGRLELVGMVIAFVGVAAIVLKGDVSQLVHLNFNLGDLAILAASISFAAYSLLLRDPAARKMASLSLFGVIALSGALVLLPPAAIELANGGMLPSSAIAWAKVGGIILFASIAAFSCFTHTVRVFGPATAGITLYMMPPVSIVLAAVFLGESFEHYHAIGIVLVTGGVVLATAPFGKK
ncbi:DMT family transporter [Agrobacterium sp. rho-13.3]|uniref:DMT family transporter n=1 Tax=Agrobacterium sp. rho-13.3 TaxID=3072980 RepID=UPI002A136D71|nr:DMT family transporter [Agrobacterium sp. rho-13.3]MDX8311281.1 DMT family transporter [Agrobacterium sp. rho-13.3]